jgi:hypothetical protein
LEGLAEPSAGHSNRLRRREPLAGFARSGKEVGKESGTERSAFRLVLGE